MTTEIKCDKCGKYKGAGDKWNNYITNIIYDCDLCNDCFKDLQDVIMKFLEGEDE